MVLNGKKTFKFNETFITSYGKDSHIGYILEVNFEHSKRLHNLHNDLPFLPERMQIKKCHKLVCNRYNKNKYAAHIRTLKRPLNHGLILKKVQIVIKFNQKEWLKTYIDINTKLRAEAKISFEKDFFKPMEDDSGNKVAKGIKNV